MQSALQERVRVERGEGGEAARARRKWPARRESPPSWGVSEHSATRGRADLANMAQHDVPAGIADCRPATVPEAPQRFIQHADNTVADGEACHQPQLRHVQNFGARAPPATQQQRTVRAEESLRALPVRGAWPDDCEATTRSPHATRAYNASSFRNVAHDDGELADELPAEHAACSVCDSDDDEEASPATVPRRRRTDRSLVLTTHAVRTMRQSLGGLGGALWRRGWPRNTRAPRPARSLINRRRARCSR